MQEVAEFRVLEKYASRLFADDEGKRLSETVRKVELATNDPRFSRIGELDREIKATSNDHFFYGWIIRRKYTEKELANAACFHLTISAVFEPAGEECGTKYDESTACPKCGAGARQVSDLRLDLRKIPKGKDIARTIANEWIVSQHLAKLMTDAGLTGFNLLPIQDKTRGEFFPMWHQLVVTAANADIVPPTRVGINPFDDDPSGQCHCPLGDLIGLRTLSELSISSTSRGDADIVCSRQFIGARQSLLRPVRLILISPKFRDLMESKKIRGIYTEVANLV